MDIEQWTKNVSDLWTTETAQFRMRVEQLSFRLVSFLQSADHEQALGIICAELDRILQQKRALAESYHNGLAKGATTSFLCMVSTFADAANHRARVARTLNEELLEELQSGPQRSGELADKLNRDRSQVSRALKSLVLAGHVLQPPGRVGSDGRGRLYALTQRPQPKAAEPNVRTGAEESADSRELVFS